MRPTYSPAVRPERRSHARIAARGEVIFHVDDGSNLDDSVMRGELLDISAGGYRVRHGHTELSIGQELLASYGWGEMIIRVVWHRDMSEGIESGFTVMISVPDDLRHAVPKTQRARQTDVAD